MKVDFRRLTWENYPSTETPINADNLNRLEEGVAGLYSDVAEIEQELGGGVGEYVTGWLNEHVDPVGSAVVVDDTLSIEGAAADAKKTGDELTSLKEEFTNKTIQTTSIVLADATSWQTYGSSFDGLAKNRIYFVAYTDGIGSVPYNGFVGSVLTYNYSHAGNAQTQMAVSRNGNRMLLRVAQAGTWYPWHEYNPTNAIMDSVNELINQANQDIEIVAEKLDSYFIQGKNLINLNDTKNLRESAYVSDSGILNPLASWNCIAVKIDSSRNRISVNKPNTYLVFLSSYTDGSLSTMTIPTQLPGFISAVVGTGTDFTKSDNIEIPENARWVVVSNSKTNFPTLQLEYGSHHTPYEAYEIKIASDVSLEKVIEVNVEDYANLRECLETIVPSKNSPVIVNIPAGTYDIKSMFTAEEIADSSFRGLFVPDYVTLRGIDSRENTILTYSSDTAEDKISTLNIYNVASLENLTIEASNIRYCVHDDYATSYDGENVRIVKNCTFKKLVNGGYACAYGAGMKGNAQWAFENCEFVGDGSTFRGFSIHNNTPVAKDSNITLKNCRFRNSVVSSQEIRVDSFNNNVTGLTYLYLIGCGFNNASKITLTESSASNYGAGIKAKVSGYGNTFGNSDVTITVTDGVDYSENVDLI